MDSMQVRITFDDAIDQDSGLVAARADVFALPDSTARAGNYTLQLEAAALASARARRPAADSVAPDSAAADSGCIHNSTVDTTARAAPRLRPGAAPPAAQEPTVPIPQKAIVLGSDTPFRPGSYAIVVSGARNVNGLAGGGSVTLTVRAPATPARSPTDTLPDPSPRR
jgi:hypothetical protein